MLKSKSCFYLLLFALALIAVNVGCQTNPYLIKESNVSIKDHRKAVVAAVGEVKSVSENGRELYTPYHNRNFKNLDEPNSPKVRYYTKVVVLGARRPYDVSVEVHKEQKDPDTNAYIDQGIDESLTRARVKAIEVMLNQSREKASPAFDVENPF